MVAAVELELRTGFGVSREILDGVGWRKGPRGRSWVEGGLLWGLFFSFSFLELERFAKCLLVEWTEPGEGEARMLEEGGKGRR